MFFFFFSFLVAFPLFYNMLFIYYLYQDLNFKTFQRTGWGEKKSVADKMSDHYLLGNSSLFLKEFTESSSTL